MRSLALVDEKVPNARRSGPYLSHSRINRYLLCPEQYRLYYVEGLRPRCPSANLVFGQVLHQTLASLFRDGLDPIEAFREKWAEANDWDLTYSPRDSWKRLSETGQTLLQRFVRDELPRIGEVHASERPFEIAVTSLDVPLVGVIDLVAEVDGARTVVDFKTAAKPYQDHEVHLSDQLTAYRLAVPEAERAALCVLVKTKEPQIEWHVATRTGPQLTEYLEKAGYVGREIASGRFYKRTGMWCSWCDFLPVCLGDDKRTRQTLIHVP